MPIISESGVTQAYSFICPHNYASLPDYVIDVQTMLHYSTIYLYDFNTDQRSELPVATVYATTTTDNYFYLVNKDGSICKKFLIERGNLLMEVAVEENEVVPDYH